MSSQGKRTRPSTAKRRTSVKDKKSASPQGSSTSSIFMKAYETLIDDEAIIEAGARLGVVQRQRKIDLTALVEATITSLSPMPGAQTNALVEYLALTGEELAPSSFYDRFTDPFATLMRELADKAVRAVREAESTGDLARDLGVLLKEFHDVRVADSTSQVLKKLAKAWAPSTSKVRPAAFKFHTVISLRDDLPLHSEIGAQRAHDNRAFPESTMEPGTLSLFDLGYIDVERFIDAIERGAYFLTRLKKSHNPTIHRIHIGKGSRVDARGMPLDDAIKDQILLADHGVIDIDVRLVVRGKEAIARVVAIIDKESNDFHWYITSVDRNTLDAFDVAEAYRLRWVIELLFKQLKSGGGLDMILAWRESAVRALVYAKVVALCLARLLELSAASSGDDALRTRLAMMLVLTRSVPLLLSHSLMRRGVTIQQMEERILLIARIAAKSRNRRRERARIKRERELGCHNP